MNRLYHAPLSPFCRKVRLTLAEKRLDVELVEERYWEPTPEFLKRNPAGKVPVLRIENRVMSESQAICEYLEEAHPNPPLMPRDVEGRYEVRIQAPRCVTGTDTLQVARRADSAPITRRFPLICS